MEDYTTALRLGKKATGFDEPYVLNSRGNAFASLGQWSEALRDYELSVKVGTSILSFNQLCSAHLRLYQIAIVPAFTLPYVPAKQSHVLMCEADFLR